MSFFTWLFGPTRFQLRRAKMLEYQANGERAAKEAGIEGLRSSERYWAEQRERVKHPLPRMPFDN